LKEAVRNVPIVDVQVIHHLLIDYCYLTVFTLVLLESAGIPLPGETALIAAAVYAGTEHTMEIGLVIAAAAGGAILDDNLGFWIGRKLGRAILVKYGHYIQPLQFSSTMPPVESFGRHCSVPADTYWDKV
jgi:membrane protein DedA with SNARE-associated domain